MPDKELMKEVLTGIEEGLEYADELLVEFMPEPPKPTLKEQFLEFLQTPSEALTQWAQVFGEEPVAEYTADMLEAGAKIMAKEG